MPASNQPALGYSSISKPTTRSPSTHKRTQWPHSCTASACSHACHLPCRHPAVLASARSASRQPPRKQWPRLRVSLNSTNSTSTIRSTPSTKSGRSHYRYTPLICSAQAFVAQWIEHLTSDQRVGGSSPSERTNVYNGLTDIEPSLKRLVGQRGGQREKSCE
jgi:hypothetical protein